MLGLKPAEEETPGGEPTWEEFPWNKYLVQEDIIKKWKSVDMKHINHLLTHFDIEDGQFKDVELEKVSVVMPAATYSQVEGLV